MVAGVPMTQAEVEAANGALHRNELLLLARFERAFVGEDLRLVRFAVLVDVLANGHVR